MSIQKPGTKLTSKLLWLVLLLATSLNSGGQQKRVVHVPDEPQGLPFSSGIVVGKTLYVSGQQGRDQDGKLRSGGIGPQTQATLENLEKIIKAAGFRLSDVVNVNVYLVDIHEFQEMNAIYKKFFPDPKPARTTVQEIGRAHV